jgi:hypothetical protein
MPVGHPARRTKQAVLRWNWFTRTRAPPCSASGYTPVVHSIEDDFNKYLEVKTSYNHLNNKGFI